MMPHDYVLVRKTESISADFAERICTVEIQPVSTKVVFSGDLVVRVQRDIFVKLEVGDSVSVSISFGDGLANDA